MFFDGKKERIVSGHRSGKRDATPKDLVENARKLRQQREIERRMNSGAEKIQKHIRGCWTRKRLNDSLRKEFDILIAGRDGLSLVDENGFNIRSLVSLISIFYASDSDQLRLSILFELLCSSTEEQLAPFNITVKSNLYLMARFLRILARSELIVSKSRHLVTLFFRAVEPHKMSFELACLICKDICALIRRILCKISFLSETSFEDSQTLLRIVACAIKNETGHIFNEGMLIMASRVILTSSQRAWLLPLLELLGADNHQGWKLIFSELSRYPVDIDSVLIACNYFTFYGFEALPLPLPGSLVVQVVSHIFSGEVPWATIIWEGNRLLGPQSHESESDSQWNQEGNQERILMQIQHQVRLSEQQRFRPYSESLTLLVDFVKILINARSIRVLLSCVEGDDPLTLLVVFAALDKIVSQSLIFQGYQLDSCSLENNLLNSIAYSNSKNIFVIAIWNSCNSLGIGMLLESLIAYDLSVLTGRPVSSICSHKLLLTWEGKKNGTSDQVWKHLSCSFHLLCCVLVHQLSAMDDEEFFEQEDCLPIAEIAKIVELLRDFLKHLYLSHPVNSSQLYQVPGRDPLQVSDLYFAQRLHLQLTATKLFNMLFARIERRACFEKGFWEWSDLPPAFQSSMTIHQDDEIGDQFDFFNPQVKIILSQIPQVLSFSLRLRIFSTLLSIDKSRHETMPHLGGYRIQIRRDHLVEDAFAVLYSADQSTLKGRIQVEFISEQGYNEAGIDGGGLFKSFIDSCIKEAFDVKCGWFIPTSEQLLTPNPASSTESPRHLDWYFFLGKLLGVAVYNRILVEPEFAVVFLNLLLGRTNHIDDLWNFDKTIHKSLLSIKHLAKKSTQEVDLIEQLGLCFEVDMFGSGFAQSVELIPGGSTVRVSSANVHSYIHRYAHHKLNLETASQCRAFLSGFRLLIPADWLKMFNPRELQILISGEPKRIDVRDMRGSVNYLGGFHDSQPYIQEFWDLIDSMSLDQQANFLRFVTSCSRQPLSGFSQMNPRFGIQQVPAWSPGQDPLCTAPRLPSAATCMNLLKLPVYRNREELRQKLLYAIDSHSGFELS